MEANGLLITFLAQMGVISFALTFCSFVRDRVRGKQSVWRCIVSGLFFTGWDNHGHFTTFANTVAVEGDSITVAREIDGGVQTVNTDGNTANHATSAPPYQNQFAPNAALSAFNQEADIAKRGALWGKVQQVVYDEVPFIEVGKFNGLSARSAKLQGYMPAIWPFFWNTGLAK